MDDLRCMTGVLCAAGLWMCWAGTHTCLRLYGYQAGSCDHSVSCHKAQHHLVSIMCFRIRMTHVLEMRRCVSPVGVRHAWYGTRVRTERVPRPFRLRAAVRRSVIPQAPPTVSLDLKRDWLLVAGQDTEGLSLLQVT